MFRKKAWAAAKIDSDYYRLVRDYFELDRTITTGEITSEGLTRGVLYDWDYATYLDFNNRWSGHPEDLARLMGVKKLYLHTELEDDPSKFLKDAERTEEKAPKPIVRSFDGSDLVVEVSTAAPCRFAWIDNWDAGWTARVDGTKVPIDRLMGTFKSVPLPNPGRHTVHFAYRPVISGRAYAGSAVGVLAFILFLGGERRRKRSGVASAT